MSNKASLFGSYHPYYQSEIYDPDNPPSISKKGRMIIQQGAAPDEYVAIFREAAAQFQQRKWFTATAPNDITCDREFYNSFQEFLHFYNADVIANPTNPDSPESESKMAPPRQPDRFLQQRRRVMTTGGGIPEVITLPLQEDSKAADLLPPIARRANPSILQILREKRIARQPLEAPLYAKKVHSHEPLEQSVIDQVQDPKWYCACELIADLQVLDQAARNNPGTFAIFRNGNREYPYRLVSYNRNSPQPLSLLFRINGENIQPNGSELFYTFPGFLLVHGLDTNSGICALMNK